MLQINIDCYRMQMNADNERLDEGTEALLDDRRISL